MMRVALWGSFWLLTLGTCSIDIVYVDGLHINFRSWLHKR